MHNLIATTARICVAASLLGFALQATATEDGNHVSAMRYLSLEAQGDDASRQYSGTASFALGSYAWLQGTVGKITTDSTSGLGDVQQFGVGTGFSNGTVRLRINFDQYKDDDSYQQRNLLAALDWMGERLNVGLDISRRSTNNSLDTVRDFPNLGLSSIALHVDEKLTGNGIGLHADFSITDALSISLGGMSYHYDSNYELSSSTNPLLIRRVLTKYPTLSELVYLNNSNVTRSLALLDNSYNLGLTYQFSNVALSALYLRDQALNDETLTDTGIISAAVFIGDRWMLSPALGRSHNSQVKGITFGGISLSYNW